MAMCNVNFPSQLHFANIAGRSRKRLLSEQLRVQIKAWGVDEHQLGNRRAVVRVTKTSTLFYEAEIPRRHQLLFAVKHEPKLSRNDQVVLVRTQRPRLLMPHRRTDLDHCYGGTEQLPS